MTNHESYKIAEKFRDTQWVLVDRQVQQRESGAIHDVSQIDMRVSI
jgi:hypothetical protein